MALAVTKNEKAKRILEEDRYTADDLTGLERDYLAKHTPKPREKREDLVVGDIVAVLEGAYASKRVVLLKQLKNNMALVSGVKSLNGCPVFKIDEKFLLRLDTTVEIDKINFDDANAAVTEKDCYDMMDCELSEDEVKVQKTVLNAISKVPGLTAYISEEFFIDQTKDFYA